MNFSMFIQWFQFVEKYIYLGFLYGHKSKEKNILINMFSPLNDNHYCQGVIFVLLRGLLWGVTIIF